MAARRIYNDQDKARAYVLWMSNGENARRTVRDSGVPHTTIRDWIREWREGDIPEINIIEQAAGDFLADAERVRDAALAQLEAKLGVATPSALVATVGMLTDKINLTKGLATSRQETVHALPSPEEVAAALTAAFQGALQAARTRDLEIIDHVAGELPVGSP